MNSWTMIFWGAAALGCGLLPAAVAGAAAKPAIVLVAFGTSTRAFDTYKHFEAKVRERFPEHDIRWAYTSKIVREKLKEEQQRDLPDLPQTLEELKAQGVTQVALQDTPGLKIALGQPLLSSLADRKRVLEALATDFPADLKENAVLLVGHGSPSPAGAREYLALYTLMLSKFKGKNVFFGVIEGQPELKNALARVKNSAAGKVTIVPLMVVAGDHFENDIMGDKDSIKAELLAAKPYEITGVDRGLGYNDGVIAVYLDHLAVALDSFTAKKKEKKTKKK